MTKKSVKSLCKHYEAVSAMLEVLANIQHAEDDLKRKGWHAYLAVTNDTEDWVIPLATENAREAMDQEARQLKLELETDYGITIK